MISSATVFIFLISLVFGFLLLYRDRIYPGVNIAQIDLGGLSVDEAKTRLLLARDVQLQTPIEIIFENKKWEFSPASLQLSYNVDLAIEQAYILGRMGRISRLSTIITLLSQGINLPFSYQVYEPAFEKYLSTISAEISIPTIPHTIEDLGFRSQDGVRVRVIKGTLGREVDVEKLRKEINERFTNLSSKPVLVSLLPPDPDFQSFNGELTRLRAERFIKRKLQISISDSSAQEPLQRTLEGADFFQFLSFDGNFREDMIASYSATLSQEVSREPQNARFVYAEGRVQEFAPAIAGLKLNPQQTAQQLLLALQRLENETEEVLSIQLTPQVIEPEITIEDVNSLGIRELVGKGTSKFRGSIPNRIHNLTLAASTISGDLIPPGETFSFNRIVGEIDAAHGYRQGYIIKDGRTILGDGGGVCQVSTTLFRAILNAGLPVVERRAHSYRVGYYEQNSKAGYDATVFAPTADLKFKNDTSNYLLLQAITDKPSYTLTIEIYGSKDGREASITNYQMWDVTPPPPDLYQDDPTLPTGEVKQVDWQAWGAKVRFDYTVNKGEEIIFNKTFYSNFQPWQNVFLRGTKQ